MRLRLLVVLLFIPVAAGAEEGDAFLDASYALAAPIDVASVEERNNRTSEPIGPSASCGEEHVSPTAQGKGFRFSESSDEIGCAEAFFEVPLPVDARSHSLRFHADRVVDQSTQSGFSFAMVQEVNVYGPADRQSPASTSAVFPPAVGTQRPAEEFVIPLDVEADAEGEVAFGLYFEDRGSQDEGSVLNPLLGQSFRATVTDLQLVSTGLPLSFTVSESDRVESGESIEETRAVGISVPEDVLGRGEVSMHLTAAGLDLLVIRGPQGQDIAGHWLTSHHEQGIIETTIAPEAVAAHGAGNYTAFYQATSSYEPVAAMVPIAAALFFLPAVAGVVADRAAGGLIRVRQGPREGGMQSTIARWALVPVAALYAGIFLAVALTGSWGILTTLPLGTLGFLAYAGLFLCLAAFLVLGYLIKRDVTKHLKRDRSERQVLNEALQAAVKELERSNVELENFAYAASHDMQEPLRKIVNYNQLVDMRYRDVLDEEGREFLGVSVDAGRRMQAFIHDLLDYSRIAADEREPEPIDLDEILDELLIDLEDMVQETGATIEREDMPVVRSRPGQLRRVFQNLIANALKYRRRDVPPQIRIGAEGQDDEWRITVEDNGPGVPDGDRERIFEPFRRGGSATGRGSGLGLAMCKRIVERSGGRMGIEAGEQGSRFWFTWPRTEENGEAASRERPARPPRTLESPPQPR